MGFYVMGRLRTVYNMIFKIELKQFFSSKNSENILFGPEVP